VFEQADFEVVGAFIEPTVESVSPADVEATEATSEAAAKSNHLVEIATTLVN